MGLPLIFILGHSFIRRLDNFVAANPNFNHQFLLNNVATFKWHDVGGRTVAKTLQYDPSEVSLFALEIPSYFTAKNQSSFSSKSISRGFSYRGARYHSAQHVLR